MATDWTFDWFVNDAETYKATPIKGVYCRRDAEPREQFMTWLKGAVRDFTEEWKKAHDGRLYDRYDGYIGDAFAKKLCNEFLFSDWYKDTYNQRPHLPTWYYVHVLGLPQGTDMFRTFCASPIEDAASAAREAREYIRAMRF